MVYDYLPLDQHSKKPLYQQLYEQIRRAVQEGTFPKGKKCLLSESLRRTWS